MKKSGDRVIGSSGDLENTVVPTNLCPACGHELNRATGTAPGVTAPRPGDISICVNCAGIQIFKEDLTVRMATDIEIASMMADDETRHVVQQAQTFFRRRGPIPKKERSA